MLLGRRFTGAQCQATILVPSAPASPEPQTARLLPTSGSANPRAADASGEVPEIFKLSPVARAFPGQILLEVVLLGIAVALALQARDLAWPRWAPLVPLAAAGLVLLAVWIHV
jgi:hypothetical protein